MESLSATLSLNLHLIRVDGSLLLTLPAVNNIVQ